MASDGPRRGDDNDSDPTTSAFHGLAKGVLRSLGAPDRADELDAQVRSLAPDGADGDTLDALVGASMLLGQSRADTARALRQQRDERGETVVHATELQTEGGEIKGVRLMVAAPEEDVAVYLGVRSVLIRTPDGELEEPLGFDPGRIEPQGENNDVTEYIIRPAPTRAAAGEDVSQDDADTDADTDTDAEGDADEEGQ
jgi:hypothetical protein